MPLQKYRADRAAPVQPNGSIPWYTEWCGGPTLAKVENCPVEGTDLRRMAYITNKPDSYFSQPAAVKIEGRIIRGFVTSSNKGFTFVPNRK